MSASSPAAKAWRKRTTPRKRVAGTPQSPKAVRPPLRASHCSWYWRICAVSSAGSSGMVAAGAMPEAWAGAAGSIARLRVVGEVAEHRARGLGEQVERGAEDAMLECGIVGPAQRVAEGERHEERTGRLGLLAVLAHHADGGGGDALGLERAGQHTSGVRAERSGRA